MLCLKKIKIKGKKRSEVYVASPFLNKGKFIYLNYFISFPS